jgi:DNA processing protein
VLRDQPGYPTLLHDIHDPPPLLYVRGTVEPDDSLAIALVGSRRCTPYGARICESLARSLCRAGLTVVSGLARGIDAAAHRGALRAGGRTLAVVANGLEEIYPPEHRELAGQIAAAGAILSEMPMRQQPIAGLFPQRNRLIAGLCLGVVVVEAAPRSGSLLTAQHAMEQNREVFAVPGPVDSLTSRGCHQLLRDGARLVQTVDDILEELAPHIRDRLPPRDPAEPETTNAPEEPPPGIAPRTLNEQERSILAHLDDLPRAADELITRTGLTASQVMATLSVLEMRRLIRRMPGNQFVRL